MPNELIAFVSCPVALGQTLAEALVKESLAACVNIINGVQSIYLWEGQLQSDKEELLMIKTRAEVWDKLKARVKELHPYDLPEIICVSIEDGYEPYLNWIKANTTKQDTLIQ